MLSTHDHYRITIAILVPDYPEPIKAPSATPIGKSALNTNNKNIRILFGNKFKKIQNQVFLSGMSIEQDQWVPKTLPIDCVHDRFPSQIRAAHFQKILPYIQDLPFGNPFEITMLCRDKIQTQRYLHCQGIRMPEMETNAEMFSEAISQWKLGFLKPQFGALGKNVRAITKEHQSIPKYLEGVVPGRQERTFLQRGIQAPSGWKGLSLRQLIQRKEDGEWQLLPAVLRRSTSDLVVNIARGAEAVLAEEHLPPETMLDIYNQSLLVAKKLQAHPKGEYSVEFGLDFVIDQDYQAWLIEVNSRPRGRLEVLAKKYPERFQSIHEKACIAPALFLAEQARKNAT